MYIHSVIDRKNQAHFFFLHRMTERLIARTKTSPLPPFPLTNTHAHERAHSHTHTHTRSRARALKSLLKEQQKILYSPKRLLHQLVSVRLLARRAAPRRRCAHLNFTYTCPLSRRCAHFKFIYTCPLSRRCAHLNFTYIYPLSRRCAHFNFTYTCPLSRRCAHLNFTYIYPLSRRRAHLNFTYIYPLSMGVNFLKLLSTYLPRVAYDTVTFSYHNSPSVFT